VVQSKIYPVYFRAMGYCLLVALLGHVFGHGMRNNNGGGVMQTWNLLASLLTLFVNSVYLEPRATKVCAYFCFFNFLLLCLLFNSCSQFILFRLGYLV